MKFNNLINTDLRRPGRRCYRWWRWVNRIGRTADAFRNPRRWNHPPRCPTWFLPAEETFESFPGRWLVLCFDNTSVWVRCPWWCRTVLRRAALPPAIRNCSALRSRYFRRSSTCGWIGLPAASSIRRRAASRRCCSRCRSSSWRRIGWTSNRTGNPKSTSKSTSQAAPKSAPLPAYKPTRKSTLKSAR